MSLLPLMKRAAFQFEKSITNNEVVTYEQFVQLEKKRTPDRATAVKLDTEFSEARAPGVPRDQYLSVVRFR